TMNCVSGGYFPGGTLASGARLASASNLPSCEYFRSVSEPIQTLPCRSTIMPWPCGASQELMTLPSRSNSMIAGGAIQHSNVVLLIHVEPSDAHHPPLVGQGKLGPVRIEFVMGAVLSLFVRLILGHGARRRRCESAAKGDGCRQGIRAQLRNCWHWFHGAIPEARRHSLKFAHPSAPRS